MYEGEKSFKMPVGVTWGHYDSVQTMVSELMVQADDEVQFLNIETFSENNIIVSFDLLSSPGHLDLR